MKKTTIFYENSAGIIAQWTGEVISNTESTIIIKFSKNKVLKFDLTANSGFMIVTNKKVSDIGLNKLDTVWSHDESKRESILKQMAGNISLYWNGKSFENK